MSLEAPRNPVKAPPARRPGSVRRTSTLLMTWPRGILAGMHLQGRARDLATHADGSTEVLDRASLEVDTGLERDIRAVQAVPSLDGLAKLVGARAGGGIRKAIADAVGDEMEPGAPLHLLLDDLAGATLIGGFVWSRWADDLPDLKELRATRPPRSMEGICSGFRPGASSLADDGSQSHVRHNVAEVAPLADVNDAESWHEQPDHPPMAMRRARRIDVWLDGGTIGIDAMFRDSCWDPTGTEVAVHEYQLLGSADAATGTLSAVEAVPRVLPYPECPGAAPNAAWMVGTPMSELRTAVLDRLRGTDSCTHLNDMLRSITDVPVLAGSLPGTVSSKIQ